VFEHPADSCQPEFGPPIWESVHHLAILDQLPGEGHSVSSVAGSGAEAVAGSCSVLK
jgi:hypothetical protein